MLSASLIVAGFVVEVLVLLCGLVGGWLRFVKHFKQEGLHCCYLTNYYHQRASCVKAISLHLHCIFYVF